MDVTEDSLTHCSAEQIKSDDSVVVLFDKETPVSESVELPSTCESTAVVLLDKTEDFEELEITLLTSAEEVCVILQSWSLHASIETIVELSGHHVV